ncbi:MAG TPA: ABC transporter ATP-binding protein [Rhodanobacteraceae bacterium]|jgi:putative ABC transport system ATP-binding protein|nr:ABC transporter ATP-binding protein [Rhodanobacteraceae bacterium]
MHALIASDLRKGFTSGKLRTEILRGLSLEVEAGQLTLIAGPSGCGKSTLLSILSGLQRPDAGRVIALGEDLWRSDKRALDRFRLQHTGFVFQGFNLFPALTALEQVMLPLGYLGISDVDAAQRARVALGEVGLAPRVHLRPAELSGGEKQRVAIARALVKQPQLVFADEPTSALDSANGQIVIDTLRRIAHTHGTTVLCVSHDPRLVTHADRVLQMEDGAILSDRRIAAPDGNAASEEHP